MASMNFAKQNRKTQLRNQRADTALALAYADELTATVADQLRKVFPDEATPAWFPQHIVFLARQHPRLMQAVPEALTATFLAQLPTDSDRNHKYFSKVLANRLGRGKGR